MNTEEKQKNTDNVSQSFINALAKEILLEQRRSRRWGIFFKFLFILYLFVFLAVYFDDGTSVKNFSGEKHTALIDIYGVITDDSNANADYIVTGLRNAFENEHTAGIILRMNSPGGSPVQADYVNSEIKRLRQQYPDIPLYAVINDICASGCYYIAAAADKIYANKASIVGSIGVVMAGFGFVDAIEKLGIERRLLHAGENKGFMDPFEPLKLKETEHMQLLLDEIHQQFIQVVKDGRGVRLTDNKQLFSGLVWTGKKSIELGLVDGLASTSQVARDIIGHEQLVNYTVRENYLDRIAKNIGSAIYNQIAKYSIWNKTML